MKLIKSYYFTSCVTFSYALLYFPMLFSAPHMCSVHGIIALFQGLYGYIGPLNGLYEAIQGPFKGYVRVHRAP